MGARQDSEARGPRLKLLLALGIAAFAVFVAVRLPAALVWQWGGKAVPEVTLTEVEGTLWRGGAKEAFYQGMSLGRLEWSFQPGALLAGEWRNRVRLESASSLVDGELGMALDGGLAARDLEVRMPLTELFGRYVKLPAWWTLSVEGVLEATVDKLAYADGQLEELAGELAVGALTVEDNLFGDVLATLAGEGGTVTAEFHSVPDAPVAMEGVAVVSPGGEYRLEYLVTDPDAMGKALGGWVQKLGSQTGDGRWRLDWKGRM